MKNYDRMKSAVDRVCALSVGELKRHQSAQNPIMQRLCEDVFESLNLDEKKLDELDFLDFICLIYQTPDYFRLDFGAEEMQLAKAFRMVQLDGLRAHLLRAEESCIPIKLFLGLPLVDFYEYLESLGSDKSLKREWKEVSKKLDQMLIRRSIKKQKAETMTIKEVLIFAGEEKRRAWLPLNSLRDYRDEIMDAYKMSQAILGHSFKLAMPERFHIQDVISKTENNKQ